MLSVKLVLWIREIVEILTAQQSGQWNTNFGYFLCFKLQLKEYVSWETSIMPVGELKSAMADKDTQGWFYEFLTSWHNINIILSPQKQQHTVQIFMDCNWYSFPFVSFLVLKHSLMWCFSEIIRSVCVCVHTDQLCIWWVMSRRCDITY